MIVADASAVVSGLPNAGPARTLLGREQVHLPGLVSPEVVRAPRRVASAGSVTAEPGWYALDTRRRLGVTCRAAVGLLRPVTVVPR